MSRTKLEATDTNVNIGHDSFSLKKLTIWLRCQSDKNIEYISLSLGIYNIMSARIEAYLGSFSEDKQR